MKKRLQIPVPLLRELIILNATTGTLTWAIRRPGHFTGPRHTALQRCAWWNGRYAGKPALAHLGANGRQHGKIFNQTFSAHRVVFALTHGRWPNEVDHINGDHLDNRPTNLREVDRTGNCRNTAKTRLNKSGVSGVTWHKSKRRWCADIRIGNGQRKHLGAFENFEDAVAARKAAEQHYGYHPNHGRERNVSTA